MESKFRQQMMDALGAIGSLVTFVVAMMSDRIRPVVEGFVERTRSMGLQGARFLRHLYDRHLVSVLLRPALVIGTVLTTVAYLGGVYCLYKLGVLNSDDVFVGLVVVASVAIVLAFFTWWSVRRARGLTDRHTLEMQREVARPHMNALVRQAVGLLATIDQADDANDALSVLAQQMLALSQQAQGQPPTQAQVEAVTAAQAVVGVRVRVAETLVQLTQLTQGIERELNDGEIHEAIARVEEQIELLRAAIRTNNREQPRVRNNPALTNALEFEQRRFQQIEQLLRNLQRDAEATTARIQAELEARVAREHGAPGRAPRVAAVIIGQWVVVGLWYLAIAVILRTWYSGALVRAGHSPEITSMFVVVGGVLLGIAFLCWLAAVTLVALSIRFGLGLAIWGTSTAAKALLIPFPGITAQNIDRFVPSNLGASAEALAWQISHVHEFPVGVGAVILMLMVTEHDVGYLQFLSINAIVLLCGYLALVFLAGIRNKWIFNAVVIFHFVLAIVQFVLRLCGSSIQNIGSIWNDMSCMANGAPNDGVAWVLLAGAALFVVVIRAKEMASRYRGAIAVIATTLLLAGAGAGLYRAVAPNRVRAARLACQGSSTEDTPESTVTANEDPTTVASSDVGFSRTVNAGEQGHSCSTTDPSRPCPP